MAGCPCPTEAALPTVPINLCKLQWDRIRKMSVCRESNFTSLTGGANATLDEMKTLAEWVTSLAASDDTKQMITVAVGDFIAVPGEAITSEFDGDTTQTGSYNPTTVTFNTKGISSAELEAMRKLTCEGVTYTMLFDKDGNIVHVMNGTIPGGMKSVAESWFLTDMGQEESGSLIKCNGGFQLVDGWSSGTGVTVTEPDDFDPLTALSN